MNISNVSFGNIVKVNSHVISAMQIASIANERAKLVHEPIKKQIDSLFPDKKDGNVIIHYTDNNTSYLFSGREANLALKLMKEKSENTYQARLHYRNSDYADFFETQAHLEYEDKIAELIKNGKNIKEINVNTEADSLNIKSINIIS